MKHWVVNLTLNIETFGLSEEEVVEILENAELKLYPEDKYYSCAIAQATAMEVPANFTEQQIQK